MEKDVAKPKIVTIGEITEIKTPLKSAVPTVKEEKPSNNFTMFSKKPLVTDSILKSKKPYTTQNKVLSGSIFSKSSFNESNLSIGDLKKIA